MLKIITAADPLPSRNNLIVIFGDIGIGKTSLAFTVEDRPFLLLDFEKGVGRAVGRKAMAQINDWAEMQEFIRADGLAPFRNGVIAIDTGKALLDDYMANAIIKMDPKTYGLLAGGLSLKGFGILKELFKGFISDLNRYNIDVIVLCHEREFSKKNEQPKMIPSMTGGSYDILMARADLVGYFTSRGDRRTLEFDPTDVHAGKNCVGFPILEIPSHTAPDFKNYMGSILQKLKAKFNEQTEAQRETYEFAAEVQQMLAGLTLDNVLDEIDSVLALATNQAKKDVAYTNILPKVKELLSMELAVGNATHDKFNEVLAIVLKMPLPEPVLKVVKGVILTCSKACEYQYNPAEGKFEPILAPVKGGI